MPTFNLCFLYKYTPKSKERHQDQGAAKHLGNQRAVIIAVKRNTGGRNSNEAIVELLAAIKRVVLGDGLPQQRWRWAASGDPLGLLVTLLYARVAGGRCPARGLYDPPTALGLSLGV